MLSSFIPQVQKLRADRTSGSAEIAQRAGRLLEAFCQRHSATPAKEAFTALVELAVKLVDAQPSMAPVFNVANYALTEAQEAERQSLTLRTLGLSLKRYRQELAARSEILDRRFAAQLGRLGKSGRVRRLLTYSNSSTVVRALVAASRSRHRFEVLCAEGRPKFEGRRLAATLARHGIPVQVLTDAALLTQVPRADLVVVGADAIFQGYIANKVGTRALLLTAWTGGCKRLVLVDSSKFLAPPLAHFFRVRQEPADEVWSRPAKSVRVLNPYFELVELELAGNLVTEQGTFTPKRLNKLIRQRPVSRALVTGLKPAVSAFPSALCREGMK